MTAVFLSTIEEGQVVLTFLVLVGINLVFALFAGILIAFEVCFYLKANLALYSGTASV